LPAAIFASFCALYKYCINFIFIPRFCFCIYAFLMK